jgi:hypothetical protein
VWLALGVGGSLPPPTPVEVAVAVDGEVKDEELTPIERTQLRRLVAAVAAPRHGVVNQVGVDLAPAPAVQSGAHEGFVLACQRRT